MKILVDFIALIMLYVLCLFKKWQSKGKYALLVNTTMYVYLSCVLLVTLMPIITSLPFIFNHPYNMYLVPFDDYLNGRGDTVRQIVLNVIMTVPFGFLFPLTQKEKNRTFQRTLLFTFLLSLSIELIQPLIDGGRSCDITDLITNSVGGIIGFIIYVIFKPVTSFVFQRKNE
ncbi:VanZ family protein [uncultured Ruminococcus sp.]|uniref:VanZ family protein n=1 Tax=uncultured Ruminococcus sp. TaxID=165186 RepID=UPI000ED582CF|nr:VanZ family protein [uncultured Ruminococcus sp.]HCJ40659.1 VanZ family protein [Ruminococcus sp.]